ncbi:MAG: MFS transporter [Promethearchaeota archaeon]
MKNNTSGNSSEPTSTIPNGKTEETETSENGTQPQKTGFWTALRTVLNYRSYSVYLVTSWILGIFGIIIDWYLMLYLRDLLLNYILIGILFTLYMILELSTRFFGGYVGDNYNRKWLSVLTMLVSGIGMFTFAIANSFILLIAACAILASSTLFASGSTSYIYENIPREHSGLAMGVFQTSSAFGLIGLAIVTWLIGTGTVFVDAIKFMFFVGGFCYIAAALIRAAFLAPAAKIERKNRNKNTFYDFFQQNTHAFRLLITILPVFLMILLLDACSDGFYRFTIMFYLNETLAFPIDAISIMLIIVLAVSVPLSITVGGFFDRYGTRRTILLVYSVMPICLILLIIAPMIPYWLPSSIVLSILATFPFLQPLLTTAFLAMAMKYINDILWMTLILTYLRRALPRTETAKMLSIFMIVIMLAFIITPIPAGILYTFFGAIPILYIALAINLLILAIMSVRNIEPKPLPE